jgi:RNA polymerase sigma-70 factor (ECF subfamily)
MNSKTEKIWKEFQTKLRQFILKRVSDKDVAEDILQEVFIKIHSHIQTLKDESKLQNWIYQITRNSIIDYYRSRKNMTKVSEILMVSESSFDNDFNELTNCVSVLIDYLPKAYRQALILTVYQGLTQKDAGEKLGISLSGAKSRVQRARRKLKNMLLECCHNQLQQVGITIDYQSECNYCTNSKSIRKK